MIHFLTIANIVPFILKVYIVHSGKYKHIIRINALAAVFRCKLDDVFHLKGKILKNVFFLKIPLRCYFIKVQFECGLRELANLTKSEVSLGF